MGLAKGITKNAAWVFSSRISRKLIHVLFVAVTARILGAQGYGVFILVSTMVLVSTMMANFGLRPMIVRMVSREKERTAELLSNVLALRLVLGVAAYVVLLIFLRLADYSEEIQGLTAIGGLAIIFNTTRDSLDSILVAYQRMKVLGAFVVASSLTFSLGGIAILTLGHGLEILFAFNVAVEAFFVLVLGAFIWKRIVHFHPRFERQVIKTVLVSCVPFFVAFLLGFIDTKVDILMLSLIDGPIENEVAIGYYGAASSILVTFMMLPRSLNMALVPVISQKIYIDQALVRNLVERATKFVMLMVSFPIILVTAFFSKEIVGLIFGPNYLPTATALMVLGWAYAFVALNVPAHSVLGSTKELRFFLPVLGVSFLLNITLNFFLIPRYSYVGSAIGSVIVLGGGFCARFYLLGRILDMPLSQARPYVKAFLVLAATLAVGYLLRDHVHVLILAPIIATVYGALLYVTGSIDREEWTFVTGALGKKFGFQRNVA